MCKRKLVMGRRWSKSTSAQHHREHDAALQRHRVPQRCGYKYMLGARRDRSAGAAVTPSTQANKQTDRHAEQRPPSRTWVSSSV